MSKAEELIEEIVLNLNKIEDNQLRAAAFQGVVTRLCFEVRLSRSVRIGTLEIIKLKNIGRYIKGEGE